MVCLQTFQWFVSMICVSFWLDTRKNLPFESKLKSPSSSFHPKNVGWFWETFSPPKPQCGLGVTGPVKKTHCPDAMAYFFFLLQIFIQQNPALTILVGGWTNPFEEYARQNGFIFPNFRGENKKYTPVN